MSTPFHADAADQAEDAGLLARGAKIQRESIGHAKLRAR
jgi:hypothetical protein